MENIYYAHTKASLYSWLVLAVIILITSIFMVKFYIKTVAEIEKNSQLAPVNKLQAAP